jgi:hypothetical protein
MKKIILFIVIIVISMSCFAMSIPPISAQSDTLVYKYWQSEYDHVKVNRIISKDAEKGWYSWDLSGDLFVVKINDEYAISGTREVNVYYKPSGYTKSIIDRYYTKEGYLYKVAHDFRVPLEVEENSASWTAYKKTIDDFYNYWKQDQPPKRETE